MSANDITRAVVRCNQMDPNVSGSRGSFLYSRLREAPRSEQTAPAIKEQTRPILESINIRQPRGLGCQISEEIEIQRADWIKTAIRRMAILCRLNFTPCTRIDRVGQRNPWPSISHRRQKTIEEQEEEADEEASMIRARVGARAGR